MTTQPAEVTDLIARIASALNRLEVLDINVQMPATFNGGGVRTDAGTLTFEHYDGPRPIATIEWADDAWRLSTHTAPAAPEGDDHA